MPSASHCLSICCNNLLGELLHYMQALLTSNLQQQSFHCTMDKAGYQLTTTTATRTCFHITDFLHLLSIKHRLCLLSVMVHLTTCVLTCSQVGKPGISGLSVEQRKRLTIAVELVANPSIVFMDEPTSGAQILMPLSVIVQLNASFTCYPSSLACWLRIMHAFGWLFFCPCHCMIQKGARMQRLCIRVVQKTSGATFVRVIEWHPRSGDGLFAS